MLTTIRTNPPGCILTLSCTCKIIIKFAIYQVDYYKSKKKVDNMKEKEKLLQQAEELRKGLYPLNDTVEYYEKALEIELKCLDIYSQVYGKYHKKILDSHESLWLLYHLLNDINKGFMHKKESIEISEKVFGKDHMHTANLYSSFGQCNCCQGNTEEGIEYLKKGFVVTEKELGASHKKTKRLKSLIERAKNGEEIEWCRE